MICQHRKGEARGSYICQHIVQIEKASRNWLFRRLFLLVDVRTSASRISYRVFQQNLASIQTVLLQQSDPTNKNPILDLHPFLWQRVSKIQNNISKYI
jgi:hypothetical protein